MNLNCDHWHLTNACCADRDIRNNRYKLDPELESPDMTKGQTRISEARALLDEALEHVERSPTLTDLTKEDLKLYGRHIGILRESIDGFLGFINNADKAEHVVLNIARAIYAAHIIGTFKIPAIPPSLQGEGKSVIDVLLQATTKRPTTEFVSRLETLDPDFLREMQATRASKMRASKATRRTKREEALIEAIHAEMTTVRKPPVTAALS